MTSARADAQVGGDAQVARGEPALRRSSFPDSAVRVDAKPTRGAFHAELATPCMLPLC
jgi:hypothetical protein